MDDNSLYQQMLDWIEESVKNARECSCIHIYIAVGKKLKELNDGLEKQRTEEKDS